MSLSRNEHAHPFALLDRRQSRRVLSMPIGDNLQSVMARKTEAPPYDDLINFPRAKDKDDIRCVMCGLPPGMGCVIPRQNKDVCKECDKSTWQHLSTSVYFKWCKGCKKFLRLGSFSEKLDAAKCDRCRERGRQSYLLKKGKECSVASSGGGRSRSNSVTSMKSDSIESDFNGALNAMITSSNSINAIASQTPQDARVFISSSSSGTSSGDDDDREFCYADSCQSRSDVDNEERMCVGSPLFGVFSPGDEDTIKSARAVASLSASHRASYMKLASSSVLSTSPTPSEYPVVIDDDTADVTKSKLSSVFGKPLCELNRYQCDVDNFERPSASLAVARPSSVNSDNSLGAGGYVGSAFRGTLYELACIHQRIVTLEEHAGRVKLLEATIASQKQQMEELRLDAARLREDLKVSRAREETSQEEAEKLRTELHDARSSVLKQVGDIVKLNESDALNALSAAIERDRKRPRVVSMG